SRLTSTRPAVTSMVAIVLAASVHPENCSCSQSGFHFVMTYAPRKTMAYRTPEIASTIAGSARLIAKNVRNDPTPDTKRLVKYQNRRSGGASFEVSNICSRQLLGTSSRSDARNVPMVNRI